MYKSCSKCGRIHDINKKCYANEKFRKKPTEANRIRNNHKWHRKAEEIKKESQYLCTICKEQGIYNFQKLEVHHIEPIEENIDRAMDDTNLICLCSQHHKQAERGEISRKHLFELVKNR